MEDWVEEGEGEGRVEFVGISAVVGVNKRGVPLSWRDKVDWAEAVVALGVEREVFEAEEEEDMVPTPPLGELEVDTEGEYTPEELGLRDPPPFPPAAAAAPPDDTLGTLETLTVKLPDALGLWELELEGR